MDKSKIYSYITDFAKEDLGDSDLGTSCPVRVLI
jgi:hypothetical protein